MKNINVVTSLVGKGLEREYTILRDLLSAHDYRVVGIHYTNWDSSPYVQANINIFLEVIHPLAFNLSRENWLFPNSEWWDTRNDQYLPKFTKICCKTRDCERIWKAKIAGDRPERVVYVGFECRDLYDPNVLRENRFLHVAGESEFKNTPAVIQAWNEGQGMWPLTVVTQHKKFADLVKSALITCINKKIPDDQLGYLMNSHRVHIMPCAYEGFGHLIHEGIGCGAIVLTTAAPPMSEFSGVQTDWQVQPDKGSRRALATMIEVTSQAVRASATKAMLYPGPWESRSQFARSEFLRERNEFRERLLEMVHNVG